MLGVGLRKLCPQDSFGYAFREKKTVRQSTPGGCKTGPQRVQHGLWNGSSVPIGPDLAAKAARKPSSGALGALLALLELSWGLWPLLGRPGLPLGTSWGSFWDLPGADLDDLDEVCGAT